MQHLVAVGAAVVHLVTFYFMTLIVASRPSQAGNLWQISRVCYCMQVLMTGRLAIGGHSRLQVM